MLGLCAVLFHIVPVAHCILNFHLFQQVCADGHQLLCDETTLAALAAT